MSTQSIPVMRRRCAKVSLLGFEGHEHSETSPAPLMTSCISAMCVESVLRSEVLVAEKTFVVLAVVVEVRT